MNTDIFQEKIGMKWKYILLQENFVLCCFYCCVCVVFFFKQSVNQICRKDLVDQNKTPRFSGVHDN